MRWVKGLAAVAIVIVVLLAGVYIWALNNTETSQTARVIAWLEADVDDWQRFPMREMAASDDPLELRAPGESEPAVLAFELDDVSLPSFLEANDSTAFLVARDGELVYEGYFNDSAREAAARQRRLQCHRQPRPVHLCRPRA